MNHAERYEHLVNKMAAIRCRGSDFDASYHAALFLIASHPALFKKMDRYLCPEGIDFTKMMRKEEFEYDWMKITADADHNLFSWSSKFAAHPCEISMLPCPVIPALFQKMDRYLCPEGIDFTKMMRKEEFEYDWMKITADAARNLFSWNSKCAATPFEISRMPAPAIRALFTACFIANGDYMVSVRKNDKGEKVFEIDDSAGKRREAFNLQMEQMMEAPGMEPD